MLVYVKRVGQRLKAAGNGGGYTTRWFSTSGNQGSQSESADKEDFDFSAFEEKVRQRKHQARQRKAEGEEKTSYRGTSSHRNSTDFKG